MIKTLRLKFAERSGYISFRRTSQGTKTTYLNDSLQFLHIFVITERPGDH